MMPSGEAGKGAVGLTVQSDDRDDEADGENENNKGVDFEAG